MTDLVPEPHVERRSYVRRVFKAVVVVIVVCLFVFGVKRIGDYFVLKLIRSPFPPAPLRVITVKNENYGSYLVQKFTFEGLPGETVPVTGVIPAEPGRRYPVIIVLYGIGMKMKYVGDIAGMAARSGFAMFVPEQYGRGERRHKKGNKLEEFMSVYRRIVLTIRETRRLVDVISQRPDVDPQRIYLWGMSFGAMTGCSVVAYDPRVKAAVLTLAAGDLQLIVSDSPYMQKKPAFSWERILAPLVAEIFRPFDPIRHIDRIAPRPLLFQNTIIDELLPRSSVDELYKAAGQPKEIVWYRSPHDRPLRAALQDAVREGLAWLQRNDARAILQPVLTSH